MADKPDTERQMSSAEEHRTQGSNLEFFLKSAGYPDRVPAGSSSFIMRVDGMEILAEESGDGITLSAALGGDESVLPVLATYSAGRMLREDAMLAWGRRSGATGSGEEVFLWQSVPAGAGATEMLRFFETFMDSLDWWRERVEALAHGGVDASQVPESMVIRP